MKVILTEPCELGHPQAFIDEEGVHRAPCGDSHDIGPLMTLWFFQHAKYRGQTHDPEVFS